MPPQPESDTTRLLVYSHDTFGLGNLRRALKICDVLSRDVPEISILVVTGSFDYHRFRVAPRVDFVKLPCVFRQARNDYSARFLDAPFREVRSMRRDMIFSTFKWFAPDIVLVDKAPTGIKGELQKSISWLKKKKPDSRLILYLRDILDDPRFVRRLWKRRRLRDAIDEYYDSIWVFGSPHVCDMVDEYSLPDAIASKVSYCGYLMPSPKLRDQSEIRHELGIDGGPFVLVTGGGGGDAYRLMTTYLQGMTALRASTPADSTRAIHSLLVLGPEMPSGERLELRMQADASAGAVQVLDFSADISNYMNAADLVVSMGGYNTMCEILTLRKRAIVVPRVRPVNEQWIRTSRMQELGLVEMIHPDELTPEIMASKVLHVLNGNDKQSFASEVLETGGLPEVSRFVSEEVRARVHS